MCQSIAHYQPQKLRRDKDDCRENRNEWHTALMSQAPVLKLWSFCCLHRTCQNRTCVCLILPHNLWTDVQDTGKKGQMATKVNHSETGLVNWDCQEGSCGVCGKTWLSSGESNRSGAHCQFVLAHKIAGINSNLLSILKSSLLSGQWSSRDISLNIHSCNRYTRTTHYFSLSSQLCNHNHV
jgi:hypothetical protein